MTEFLLKIFVKDKDNTSDPAVRSAYGSFSGFLGIFLNLLLSVTKIAAGLLSASISVVADGLNNLSDMGSSIITLVGFKLSNKPADADHPFGHGRMEYISGFVVSLLILLVGFELIKDSLGKLIAKTPAPTYTLLPVIILIISIAVKFWMYLFNRKLGKKIASDALFLAAQDSLNDCLATLAILLAVLISKFVFLPFNLDAVMGFLVGAFIVYSGFNAAKGTLDDLLGKPPTKEFVKELENLIMSFDGFLGVHDLIVHNYGAGRCFASVHVEVPEDVDIVKCHEKIDLCEKLVNEKFDIILVIHMDPIDVSSPITAKTREKMADALKGINEKITIHDFRMTPKSDDRTNLIFDMVIPSEIGLKDRELIEKANELARKIDKTFVCVITVDRNYL